MTSATEQDVLRELLDREELRRLGQDYAAAADGLDNVGWADLFTPDGVFESTVAGDDAPMYAVTGRDELLGVITLLAHYRMTQHYICNHRIDLDGDTATGEVYCVANHLIESDGAVDNFVMNIKYLDDYVRTANGWRFARRHLVSRWLQRAPIFTEVLSVDGNPPPAVRVREPMWNGGDGR
jgi:hypothetical protein